MTIQTRGYGRTDRPTDRPTDIATFRAAIAAKNDHKIKSKSNVRIQGIIENLNCSTT